MNFALSKEQELFQKSIKKYLTVQEKTAAARHFVSGDTSRYEKVWAGLAELGAMAINVPEAYGGAELTFVDLIPVFEETGRVLLPGVLAETVAFATPVLVQYGTEAQKEQYLPRIAEGAFKCSLAVAEAQHASFQTRWTETTAEQTADGYVLRGTKTFVLEADQVDALFVTAQLGEEVALFIVDRQQANWQSKRLKVVDETVGVSEVSFDAVHVPAQALIADGQQALDYGLNFLNAAIATASVGAMEEIVEMCAEYAKTREQFGHPIGVFQAVKHRIVDMKVETELAKSLVYYAMSAVADGNADAKLDVLNARAFAAEAFIEVAAHNIQMHGGIGYTEEIDCHLFLKRAHLLENYLSSKQNRYEMIIQEQGWRNNEGTIQQSEVLQSGVTN